jgi:hypothetical protein
MEMPCPADEAPAWNLNYAVSSDDTVTRHVVGRIRQFHAPLLDETQQQRVERGDDAPVATELEGPSLLD